PHRTFRSAPLVRASLSSSGSSIPPARLFRRRSLRGTLHSHSQKSFLPRPIPLVSISQDFLSYHPPRPPVSQPVYRRLFLPSFPENHSAAQTMHRYSKSIPQCSKSTQQSKFWEQYSWLLPWKSRTQLPAASLPVILSGNRLRGFYTRVSFFAQELFYRVSRLNCSATHSKSRQFGPMLISTASGTSSLYTSSISS